MDHGAGKDGPAFPVACRPVEAPITRIKPTPIKSGIQIFILLQNNQQVRNKAKNGSILLYSFPVLLIFWPKSTKEDDENYLIGHQSLLNFRF